MSLLKSFVLQTANAPGTGTFSLIAPPTGRRSFASSVGAGQVFYEAFDGTSFEEGVGTLTTGAQDTLSRDTVTDGTSGAGVKINFASTVQIYSYIPAARALFASADNASVPFGSRVLSAVGPGVAQSDAPRMDQVAWLRIGPDVVVGAGTTTQSFVLDTSKYIKFRLEWTSAVPAVLAPPFCRFSQNGGGSYLGGATDYFDVIENVASGASAPVDSSGSISFGPLGSTPPGTGPGISSGYVEIDPTNYVMQAHSAMSATGGLGLFDVAFVVALTAAPTNIQFGFVSTTISAARLRLTGWAI